MIVTNSTEVAERVWSYCNQGRRKGSGWFEHFTLGSNYRLTGFQAALLCDQLKKLPGQTRTRAENVADFREQLRSFSGFTMPEVDPRVENHPYYLVTLRYVDSAFAGLSRDTVLRALQAEGIPVQPTYPYPLYRNPLFQRRRLASFQCRSWRAPQEYESLSLPASERICREGVWLEHNLFLGDKRDMVDILSGFEKVQKLAPKLREREKELPKTTS